MTPILEILANRKVYKETSAWPCRGAGNRLEPEAWPIIRPKFNLADARTIYTVGSCFARNIEEHLARAGYEVPTLGFAVPPEEWGGRPNGILNKFTAPSILQEMQWTAALLDGAGEQTLTETLLQDGEQFIDMGLAGFRPVSWERGVERRRQLFELSKSAFTADVVIITFGLAEAWFDGETQCYVQQTPGHLSRRYPGRFFFQMLNFAETFAMARQIVDLVTQRHADVRFLITTSPVPLGTTFSHDDILIANTYAKSMLRTVCGELEALYPHVGYFPSYESVTLSKSPDVWADDLIHVHDEFVGKIVSRLLGTYFARGV